MILETLDAIATAHYRAVNAGDEETAARLGRLHDDIFNAVAHDPPTELGRG